MDKPEDDDAKELGLAVAPVAATEGFPPPVKKQHKHMFLTGGATCDDCTMGVAEVIRELETDISELKLHLLKMQ